MSFVRKHLRRVWGQIESGVTSNSHDGSNKQDNGSVPASPKKSSCYSRSSLRSSSLDKFLHSKQSFERSIRESLTDTAGGDSVSDGLGSGSVSIRQSLHKAASSTFKAISESIRSKTQVFYVSSPEADTPNENEISAIVSAKHHPRSRLLSSIRSRRSLRQRPDQEGEEPDLNHAVHIDAPHRLDVEIPGPLLSPESEIGPEDPMTILLTPVENVRRESPGLVHHLNNNTAKRSLFDNMNPSTEGENQNENQPATPTRRTSQSPIEKTLIDNHSARNGKNVDYHAAHDTFSMAGLVTPSATELRQVMKTQFQGSLVGENNQADMANFLPSRCQPDKVTKENTVMTSPFNLSFHQSGKLSEPYEALTRPHFHRSTSLPSGLRDSMTSLKDIASTSGNSSEVFQELSNGYEADAEENSGISEKPSMGSRSAWYEARADRQKRYQVVSTMSAETESDNSDESGLELQLYHHHTRATIQGVESNSGEESPTRKSYNMRKVHFEEPSNLDHTSMDTPSRDPEVLSIVAQQGRISLFPSTIKSAIEALEKPTGKILTFDNDDTHSSSSGLQGDEGTASRTDDSRTRHSDHNTQNAVAVPCHTVGTIEESYENVLNGIDETLHADSVSKNAIRFNQQKERIISHDSLTHDRLFDSQATSKMTIISVFETGVSSPTSSVVQPTITDSKDGLQLPRGDADSSDSATLTRYLDWMPFCSRKLSTQSTSTATSCAVTSESPESYDPMMLQSLHVRATPVRQISRFTTEAHAAVNEQKCSGVFIVDPVVPQSASSASVDVQPPSLDHGRIGQDSAYEDATGKPDQADPASLGQCQSAERVGLSSFQTLPHDLKADIDANIVKEVELQISNEDETIQNRQVHSTNKSRQHLIDPMDSLGASVIASNLSSCTNDDLSDLTGDDGACTWFASHSVPGNLSNEDCSISVLTKDRCTTANLAELVQQAAASPSELELLRAMTPAKEFDLNDLPPLPASVETPYNSQSVNHLIYRPKSPVIMSSSGNASWSGLEHTCSNRPKHFLGEENEISTSHIEDIEEEKKSGLISKERSEGDFSCTMNTESTEENDDLFQYCRTEPVMEGSYPAKQELDIFTQSSHSFQDSPATQTPVNIMSLENEFNAARLPIFTSPKLPNAQVENKTPTSNSHIPLNTPPSHFQADMHPTCGNSLPTVPITTRRRSKSRLPNSSNSKVEALCYSFPSDEADLQTSSLKKGVWWSRGMEDFDDSQSPLANKINEPRDNGIDNDGNRVMQKVIDTATIKTANTDVFFQPLTPRKASNTKQNMQNDTGGLKRSSEIKDVLKENQTSQTTTANKVSEFTPAKPIVGSNADGLKLEQDQTIQDTL